MKCGFARDGNITQSTFSRAKGGDTDFTDQGQGLLQLIVFFARFHKWRQVGIGVFPEREEILI